jgi:hypothetical protein
MSGAFALVHGAKSGIFGDLLMRVDDRCIALSFERWISKARAVEGERC